MSGAWCKSEGELGPPVIAYLESFGCEVFQEVQHMSGGPVADLVGRFGRRTWVVELKRTASLAVLEQAERWEGWASFVSVAVPTRPTPMFRRVAAWLGIGVLEVTGFGSIETRAVPRLCRAPERIHGLADYLRPEHKTFATAGNNRGQRWSPYAATCRDLLERVAREPGLSIRSAVDGLRHHYASDQVARTALLHWIHAGKVRGVEARRDGRRIRLYPASP